MADSGDKHLASAAVGAVVGYVENQVGVTGVRWGDQRLDAPLRVVWGRTELVGYIDLPADILKQFPGKFPRSAAALAFEMVGPNIPEPELNEAVLLVWDFVYLEGGSNVTAWGLVSLDHDLIPMAFSEATILTREALKTLLAQKFQDQLITRFCLPATGRTLLEKLVPPQSVTKVTWYDSDLPDPLPRSVRKITQADAARKLVTAAMFLAVAAMGAWYAWNALSPIIYDHFRVRSAPEIQTVTIKHVHKPDVTYEACLTALAVPWPAAVEWQLAEQGCAINPAETTIPQAVPWPRTDQPFAWRYYLPDFQGLDPWLSHESGKAMAKRWVGNHTVTESAILYWIELPREEVVQPGSWAPTPNLENRLNAFAFGRARNVEAAGPEAHTIDSFLGIENLLSSALEGDIYIHTVWESSDHAGASAYITYPPSRRETLPADQVPEEFR